MCNIEAREALSPWKILIFPVVGSIVLVVLFFWLKKIFWLLVGIVAFSSLSSLSYVLYPLWFKLLEVAPRSYRYRTFRLPQRVAQCCGITILPTAVPVSLFMAIGIVSLWLSTSNWFVTNLIAACLAITGIVSIPISAGKIATILLSIFWVYDIFWVFISPLIFPKNVMETVAIGVAQLQLPLVLKIPRFASFTAAPTSHMIPHISSAFAYLQLLLNRSNSLEFLMLGLGDIILPGLALNFFYRRDELLALQQEENNTQFSEENGDESEELENIYTNIHTVSTSNNQPHQGLTYYTVAQIGYAFGMVLTFVMLILLRRGQPALLYLVPCTLLPPFILAWRRKQLGWLWNSLSDSEVAAIDADVSRITENERINEEDFADSNGEEMEDISSTEEMNDVGSANTDGRSRRRTTGGIRDDEDEDGQVELIV